MIIEGTVRRAIDPGSGGMRTVEIPFLIDTDAGTYSQWGHDHFVLGENVDLLEALRDAAVGSVEEATPR